MSWLPFIIASLVAGLVLLIWFIFFSKKTYEDYEDAEVKVELYKATWCSHCSLFLPKFQEFQKMVTTNKLSVDVHVYDEGKDGDQQKFVENQISTFPTILIIQKDGTKLVYDGDRTAEALYCKVTEYLKDVPTPQFCPARNPGLSEESPKEI